MFEMAYHSHHVPLNLQQFAEGPEPEPTPTPEPAPAPEPSPEPGTPEPEPAPQPQTIKVKFNHEEKELTLDEAVQLAQKGMNYDKVTEKLNSLQSDPRYSFVDELAKEYGLTPEQFIESVKKEREQARLDALIQQNIPEDVAKEIMENRKFREEWEAQQSQLQTQQRQQAEISAFITEYPDVKFETIPDSVLAEVDNGKPLVDAYRAYENQQLKAKIAEFEAKLQALDTNNKNAATSPGSVTGNGSASGDFISFEAFEANKHDQRWVMKNLSKIQASRANW